MFAFLSVPAVFAFLALYTNEYDIFQYFLKI